MPTERLSLPAARRVALAAQGFNDPRPTGKVDRRHLRRVLDRMGVIQIDSVNVLVRSQELPLFARLGAHPRTLIPDASDAGELFECWVHEACHVPSTHRHLYGWTMIHSQRGQQRIDDLHHRRPGFVEHVYKLVAQGGIVSGDVSQRVGPKGSWWDWDDGKLALEHLFVTGRVTARRRRNDFARIYELPEHRLPAAVLDRPHLPERDARKELLAMAARHHGIATFSDLTDYHRQAAMPCKPLLLELVEEGTLLPVRVEGWQQQAYMHRDASVPRRVSARALLSPFDPVVWCRDRVERLFGFHYRIEIYTPQPKRVFGYYVLPFLLGDELVGRVDLKADRQGGRLLVQGTHVEPGVSAAAIAPELAAELQAMAAWLELDDVVVMPRGDASGALARVLGHATVDQYAP